MITVNLKSLTEKTRTFTITIDNDYTVLDFIIYLKNYENVLGIYSLMLPNTGLVSPANLHDKILPQAKDAVLNVNIYHPITYRNSFNLNRPFFNNSLL